MGTETGPIDPREAEAVKFNAQQEAKARAEQLNGTTEEQAQEAMKGLREAVDNPMGLSEKSPDLGADKPVENLPGIIEQVTKLRQGGMNREDIPAAVLGEIPEEQRKAFLDRIDEIIAEAPVATAKAETAETKGPETVTLKSGVEVSVGDILQVENVKGEPVKVKVLNFDGGSVEVEDFDAEGKSAGGRSGDLEFILKGAKLAKA